MTESRNSTDDPESTKNTDNFLARILHHVGRLGDKDSEILRFLLLMTLILTVCGPTLALTFGPSLALVFVGVVLTFTFVIIALDRACTHRSPA